jgi:hypothetical protein
LGLGLIERGLIVALVEYVEQVSLFHVRAVGHGLAREVAGHFRLQRHAADRLGRAHVVKEDRHGLFHHGLHRNRQGILRRCAGGLRLCVRRLPFDAVKRDQRRRGCSGQEPDGHWNFAHDDIS